MHHKKTSSGAVPLRVAMLTTVMLVVGGACTRGDEAQVDRSGAAGLGNGADAQPLVTRAVDDGDDAGLDPGLDPGLQAAYVLARQRGASAGYAVHDGAAGLWADNPAQSFEVVFDERGVGIRPERNTWNLRLSVDGLGCAGAIEPLTGARPEADDAQGNRVWHDHGALLAWYLNGPLGLEQGFEVHERPACDDGAWLRIEVGVNGLRPTLGRQGEVVLLSGAGLPAMTVDGLYVIDAEGMAVEAVLDVGDGVVVMSIDAAHATFPLSIDPMWAEQDKLTAGDSAAGDQFGSAVSISGDTAVVGAFLDDDGSTDVGSAYVFVRNGTVWTEQEKLLAGDAAAGDRFGSAVSISGDTVVVGAFLDDDGSTDVGSAYVFVRNGTVWTEQEKLLAGDAAAGDQFGRSVSISGNTVVGAFLDDDGSTDVGSAYVFVRNGTTWTEQEKLLAGDAAAGDQFGRAVSIFGDTAVVGAFLDDDGSTDVGSAYVFVRNGTIWTEQEKLLAGDAAAGDQFGSAVSISGDTAVVGAFLDDDGSTDVGSAYIFVRNGTTWTEQEKVLASDSAAGDQFGNAVSISGNTVVVGAFFDDDGSVDAGSACVFIFDDTGDSCGQDTDCFGGFCVDGLCCDSACGGNLTTDCLACAAALTGVADGTCAPISAGTECRASAGTCDVSEVCDGSSGGCPVDVFEANGTPCDDGDVCTEGDTCAEGVCSPGEDSCGSGGAGGSGSGGSGTGGSGGPATGGAATGSGAGGASMGTGAPPSPAADGGCACRLGGPPRHGSSGLPPQGLAALLALALAGARRRCRA